MKHKIEYDCQCDTCEGTGLYQGMGERDGFAVVCHRCEGTGKRHEVITYRDFNGQKRRKGVKQVLEVNPGIGAGVSEEHGLTLESFGGIPYKDWVEGKPFPLGSEMRAFTCPAWWYQSADYDKKPNWNWCRALGGFSACSHFKTKELCWARWDKENNQS